MPYLKINYKTIHYRDVPPTTSSSKPPILLLHGLGSSQNFYTPLTPILTSNGHRVIAADLAHSGRSSYTQVEQSVSTLSQDIIDILDGLSISKAILVGHSMSGMTVPHCASLHPSRVIACVLLCPVYPTSNTAPMFEERITKVEKNGMEAMADTVPFTAVGSNAGILTHGYIRELLLGQKVEGYISMCRVIANAWTEKIGYEGVKCPVLILAGEEDKSAPVSGCEKIMSELGTNEKRMEVMKGVGHWPAIEAPADVGGQIVKFADELQ